MPSLPANIRRILIALGILVLLGLAAIGWVVLFVSKPDVLAKARARYIQATQFDHRDLSQGPCLGKIADDWVLDIAHLPREQVDDAPANQCTDYREGKVDHFVEMSPKGEVIFVH